MEESVWSSELASLMPVIVGGVIGLAGGIGGPWLIHILRRNDERKKKREEKFEELVSALYEHEHWLDAARRHIIFDGEDPGNMSPLGKARTIATIYFPEFDDALSKLESGSNTLEMWMLGAAQRRLSSSSNWDNGHQEAYLIYRNSFSALLKELQDYANKEFS